MADKEIIINDLKEMIYKLQVECVEKTDNILALGEQLKSVEKTIEILEAKIGGYEYAISDIVKEYQGKLDRKEQEFEELKKQLESTKGLVTVGNKQLAEALLELQKYKDNEQQEKEIQKLYNKFEGSSLIDYKNK